LREIPKDKETREYMETTEWIQCAPFERLMQMEIMEARDGGASLRMPVTPDVTQGGGLLHGGALMGLADTAVAMAIKSLLEPGTRFATTEAHSEFLAPVREGDVFVRAQVTGHEDRHLRGEALVYDAANREVMRFSARFTIAREDFEQLQGAPHDV